MAAARRDTRKPASWSLRPTGTRPLQSRSSHAHSTACSTDERQMPAVQYRASSAALQETTNLPPYPTFKTMIRHYLVRSQLANRVVSILCVFELAADSLRSLGRSIWLLHRLASSCRSSKQVAKWRRVRVAVPASKTGGRHCDQRQRMSSGSWRGRARPSQSIVVHI